MTRLPSISRSLAIMALILLSGCSWFSHKRDKASAGNPEPAASAQAEGAATVVEADMTSADATADDAQATPRQGPGALVEDFYAMHKRLGNSGLPNSGAANAYNAFLCPSLSDLILDARKRQQQFIASHPDDKPPLIEGDLFSSLFEGPESAKAGESVINGDRARVSLELRSDAGAKVLKWTDTVVLELDDGIWCIDDVEYQGKWPFANRGKLSDSLKADF
jgi:hypothetical protein